MTGSPALLTINLRREWAPGRADIEWRDRVAEALVCARQLAWSVLHCFEAGLATPEIRGALPGLEPLAVEAIHRFSGASPLDNRAVADALTGTQTIYVVGIVTARTMLATALTASERSWRVRFIAEACRDLSPGSQASIGDRADLVQRVSMQTAFRSSSGNVIELHKWRVEGGAGQ